MELGFFVDDDMEIERELQQLEAEVLRLTRSFFGHTDAEQIALFQNEPAKNTNDKRKGYVALAFRAFQFAKIDMTLRSLCEAYYAFGIAEAMSFNLGIELGNRQKGQKASKKFTDGNKNKAVEFWLNNNFGTKKEAAEYMHDNLIVNATVKTILDNYLVGLKKPTC